jgi:hypothetical protein
VREVAVGGDDAEDAGRNVKFEWRTVKPVGWRRDVAGFACFAKHIK